MIRARSDDSCGEMNHADDDYMKALLDLIEDLGNVELLMGLNSLRCTIPIVDRRDLDIFATE
jgi:hypothetical protein